MDYCHPCRRHLNGALACPGCGTPAETPPARP
ncbi:SCO2400 family protein, partial [Streptomyces prasinopilosus]